MRLSVRYLSMNADGKEYLIFFGVPSISRARGGGGKGETERENRLGWSFFYFRPLTVRCPFSRWLGQISASQTIQEKERGNPNFMVEEREIVFTGDAIL